jgi:hypothetical protein
MSLRGKQNTDVSAVEEVLSLAYPQIRKNTWWDASFVLLSMKYRGLQIETISCLSAVKLKSTA